MDDEIAFEILGIAPGATPADIDRAFRLTAKEVHPDHGGRSAAFRIADLAHKHLKSASPAPPTSWPTTEGEGENAERSSLNKVRHHLRQHRIVGGLASSHRFRTVTLPRELALGASAMTRVAVVTFRSVDALRGAQAVAFLENVEPGSESSIGYATGRNTNNGYPTKGEQNHGDANSLLYLDVNIAVESLIHPTNLLAEIDLVLIPDLGTQPVPAAMTILFDWLLQRGTEVSRPAVLVIATGLEDLHDFAGLDPSFEFGFNDPDVGWHEGAYGIADFKTEPTLLALLRKLQLKERRSQQSANPTDLLAKFTHNVIDLLEDIAVEDPGCRALVFTPTVEHWRSTTLGLAESLGAAHVSTNAQKRFEQTHSYSLPNFYISWPGGALPPFKEGFSLIIDPGMTESWSWDGGIGRYIKRPRVLSKPEAMSLGPRGTYDNGALVVPMYTRDMWDEMSASHPLKVNEVDPRSLAVIEALTTPHGSIIPDEVVDFYLSSADQLFVDFAVEAIGSTRFKGVVRRILTPGPLLALETEVAISIAADKGCLPEVIVALLLLSEPLAASDNPSSYRRVDELDIVQDRILRWDRVWCDMQPVSASLARVPTSIAQAQKLSDELGHEARPIRLDAIATLARPVICQAFQSRCFSDTWPVYRSDGTPSDPARLAPHVEFSPAGRFVSVGTNRDEEGQAQIFGLVSVRS